MYDDYMEPIELVSFGAIATRPPEMAMRSFEFFEDRKTRRDHLDTIDIDGLSESLELSPTGEVSRELLANRMKASTLRPSMKSHDLYLPNGWDSKRLSYVLVVRTEKTAGMAYTYIQGYTDKYEIDHRYNEPADDTVFYINRITTVLEMEDMYGNTEYRVSSAYEVVHNKHTGRYEFRDELEFDRLSRADDVMLDITVDELGVHSKRTNLSNRITDSGKLARVGQKTGSGLMADIVNAHSKSMNYNSGMDDVNTLMNSVSQLSSADASTIPFIAMLSHIREDIRMSRSETPVEFTYAELVEMFPDISSEHSLIIEADEDAIYNAHSESLGYEEDSMVNESEAAVIASDFMNHVMDRMANYSIKSIGFSMHNIDAMNLEDVDIEILDDPVFFIRGLPEDMRRSRMRGFIRDIRDVFFRPVSEFGERLMFLAIFINEDFEGKIVIYGDGIEKRQFPVTPTLSSITTPLLTTADSFRKLSNGFKDILDNLKD